MSEIKVYLRIRGDLPQEEEWTSSLKGIPFQVKRRGQQVGRARSQAVDVLLLKLASWESFGDPAEQDRAIQEQLLPAVTLIEQLTPMLVALDRSRCIAELSISTIRQEDQGGFELPAELVAAAGAARLSLGVSILVMLDKYDPDDNDEAQQE